MAYKSDHDQNIGLSKPLFININSTQRIDFPTSSSTNFRLKLQAPDRKSVV